MAAINTQMTIICVLDSLKCKVLSDIFKEASPRWFMNLPRISVTSYQKSIQEIGP